MPESEIGIWQQPALPLSVMFCFCLLHCGFQGRKNPWSTPHLESSRKLGKSQEAMLVELDLDGIRSEVTFSAVDKARDPIPVEVKLAQSGTYVLKLSSVPEDFQAISLRVMVEGQTRRLYTNIDQVEQEIASEKAQIQELDDQIAAYQVQITQTSERMPYLSRQQRTDAENSIETWKKEIAECQEKQQAATEQITELVDEQEKQKQLLESSELEDFERQSEPASVSESDTKEQESEETK
mgnify:CR=1 FL=1